MTNNYTKRDFKDAVREGLEGRGVKKQAGESAMEEFCRDGNYQREHIKDCIKRAEALSSFVSEEDSEASPTFLPSIQLESENLMRWLRPTIQRLRIDLFGKEQVTLKGLGEAAEWIEKTVSEWRGRAECNNYLEYAVPGQPAVVRAPAFIGSPLEKLEKVTSELQSETGLRQAYLVAHALADIPIILPPVRITFSQRSVSFPHTWATVEFHTADLSFEQLRSVYNSIRRRMGTTRRKALTNRDAQLLEEIRKRGEPPKKEKGNRGAIKAYWESFVKDWNRNHQKGRFKSWRAAQARYERLKVKTARH